MASFFYFSEDFDFDFANTTDKSILLDEPEKLEEKSLSKAVRGNKLYTIKNYSLNSITCDDNGAYDQRRITKTNYFVTRKSNSTVMKVQIVHKSRRSEEYFHKERDGRSYNDAHATVMLNRVMKHYEPL